MGVFFFSLVFSFLSSIRRDACLFARVAKCRRDARQRERGTEGCTAPAWKCACGVLFCMRVVTVTGMAGDLDWMDCV
jgi:hypothetical protein